MAVTVEKLIEVLSKYPKGAIFDITITKVDKWGDKIINTIGNLGDTRIVSKWHKDYLENERDEVFKSGIQEVVTLDFVIK